MGRCMVSCCRRSEEHTSELQSLQHLVCRLLLEKKNTDLADPCCRHEQSRPRACVVPPPRPQSRCLSRGAALSCKLLARTLPSCFFFFKGRAPPEISPFPPPNPFPF